MCFLCPIFWIYRISVTIRHRWNVTLWKHYFITGIISLFYFVWWSSWFQLSVKVMTWACHSCGRAQVIYFCGLAKLQLFKLGAVLYCSCFCFISSISAFAKKKLISIYSIIKWGHTSFPPLFEYELTYNWCMKADYFVSLLIVGRA